MNHVAHKPARTSRIVMTRNGLVHSQMRYKGANADPEPDYTRKVTVHEIQAGSEELLIVGKITLDLFRYDQAVDQEPRRETRRHRFSGDFDRTRRTRVRKGRSRRIDLVPPLVPQRHLRFVFDEHQRRDGPCVQDADLDRASQRQFGQRSTRCPIFEPMKDMVVHMDPFWDKYSRLKPYLQPADKDSDHERERRVSPEDMKKLVAVANCVMCATCYSLCPVVSVDPSFAGPGRDRVRVSLHRRYARFEAKRTRRADQRRLPVALRALLCVLVLPQARRSARSHHRYEAQVDRNRHEGRPGPASRAHRRKDD